jgi:hypothetical protein
VAVLFSDLLGQAQVDSNKESDGALTSANWLVLINRRIESLWRKLTSLDPELYFTSSDFSLAGGVSGSTKDLATLTGFRVLHGLDVNPDNSARRTVPRRNFADRNNVRVGWWIPGPFTDDRQYDVRGRILAITPPETSSGTYRAYYRQGPYLFTGTGDTNPIDPVLEPWAAYLSLGSARDALVIEETDVSQVDIRLAEINQEIVEAHARDEGQWGIADTETYD